MVKGAVNILLLLFLAPTAFCQSYSYEEVVSKAGKALQQVLPAHLIPATEIYYSPYYLAHTPEEEWLLLEKGKKTKGKMQKINVRYEFDLRHTTCPNYSDIRTVIDLELDNKLNLVAAKGLEEIPDFVLKNLPCTLLTIKEAAAIAAENGVPAEERYFALRYNKETKRFSYFTRTIPTPSVSTHPQTGEKIKIQTFRIDAETGEVLENSFIYGTTKP